MKKTGRITTISRDSNRSPLYGQRCSELQGVCNHLEELVYELDALSLLLSEDMGLIQCGGNHGSPEIFLLALFRLIE